MAAAGKKKVVKKDDLRRLMKEKQSSSKGSSKQIEHPLAKYNSVGQLVCVVCQQQVKSNLLWTAHINSRSHKENIARLKAEKEKKDTPSVRPPPVHSSSLKRKAADSYSEHPSKITKGSSLNNKGLPDDFFDDAKKPKSILKNAPKSILKNAPSKKAPAITSYDEDEEEEMASAPAPPPTAAPATEASGSSVQGLPSDFFDQGVAPAQGQAAEREPSDGTQNTMAEKLPEGFFDDPKQDAKIRKVEYKDKLDEEWELFQKVMKEETTVSEAIVQEDEEQREVERNIEEIDEQMKRWDKVEKLIKKKEKVMSNKETEKKEAKTQEEEELDEQEEFEEFLDWRSKKAWK